MFEGLDVPTHTPEQLAKKHGVELDYISQQLAAGVKVEKEHTTDTATAREIALDHLNERPDYYEVVKRVGLEEDSEVSFKDALTDFLPLAVKYLELESIPKIKLLKSIEGKNVPTFGSFQNDNQQVSVNISNRHPNDILRTLAHELVHHKQNELNLLDQDSWKTGSGAENEANAEAGVIMRMFNQKYPQYLKLKPVMVENFADGKNPQDKGDSVRHGIPKGATFGRIRKSR